VKSEAEIRVHVEEHGGYTEKIILDMLKLVKTASKALTQRQRNTLRDAGILQKKGNQLELSPRAHAMLERNGK